MNSSNEEVGRDLKNWGQSSKKESAPRLRDGQSPFIASVPCFASTFAKDLFATSRKPLAADRQRFARYFHACLDGGVYFAPSQFEAGFLSLAHSEADIEQSVRVAAEAVKTAG